MKKPTELTRGIIFAFCWFIWILTGLRHVTTQDSLALFLNTLTLESKLLWAAWLLVSLVLFYCAAISFLRVLLKKSEFQFNESHNQPSNSSNDRIGAIAAYIFICIIIAFAWALQDSRNSDRSLYDAFIAMRWWILISWLFVLVYGIFAKDDSDE